PPRCAPPWMQSRPERILRELLHRPSPRRGGERGAGHRARRLRQENRTDPKGYTDEFPGDRSRLGRCAVERRRLAPGTPIPRCDTAGAFHPETRDADVVFESAAIPSRRLLEYRTCDTARVLP